MTLSHSLAGTGPCYLCRRGTALTETIVAIQAPVCLACAGALGRLIVTADGATLGRVWTTDESPAFGPRQSARWHAAAAKIFLRGGDHRLALAHAGLALLAVAREPGGGDAEFALGHALAVAFSPEIYRSGVASELRNLLFPV